VAGSSRYTAVLDANVLYPTLVRDVLMSLAVEGLYHAKWSTLIHEEWVRNLSADRPDIADRLPAVAALMNSTIPDSLVTGFESLIPSLSLPDPQNRHVLAVAIAGHADAIVTFNLDDFPQERLDPFNSEVQHPDRFVNNQLNLHYRHQSVGSHPRARSMRAGGRERSSRARRPMQASSFGLPNETGAMRDPSNEQKATRAGPEGRRVLLAPDPPAARKGAPKRPVASLRRGRARPSTLPGWPTTSATSA
jgi:predicted nucleic acid-binding protein